MSRSQMVIAIPAICVIDVFSYDEDFTDWGIDKHIESPEICIYHQYNYEALHEWMMNLWKEKGGKGNFAKNMRITGTDLERLKEDRLYYYMGEIRGLVDKSFRAISDGRAVYYQENC